MSGVQMGPGATPLTLMPLGASCSASDLMKATMAPLVDVYSISLLFPLYALIEVVFMMLLPSCIYFRACLIYITTK